MNIYLKLAAFSLLVFTLACGPDQAGITIEPPSDNILIGRWEATGEHPTISYEFEFETSGQVARTTFQSGRPFEKTFNHYTMVAPETGEFFLGRNIMDEKVNIRITVKEENSDLAKLECFLPDKNSAYAYKSPPLPCFFDDLKRVK